MHFALDIFQELQREQAIRDAQLIISMLPAYLHIKIAENCLKLGKNLITASYSNEAMNALDEEVKKKGLIFLNEMGLDPGINHMSAMRFINKIKALGGNMLLFETFTGGLLASQKEENLWNHKFTWNPQDLVLAGQGGRQPLSVSEGLNMFLTINFSPGRNL